MKKILIATLFASMVFGNVVLAEENKKGDETTVTTEDSKVNEEVKSTTDSINETTTIAEDTLKREVPSEDAKEEVKIDNTVSTTEDAIQLDEKAIGITKNEDQKLVENKVNYIPIALFLSIVSLLLFGYFKKN